MPVRATIVGSFLSAELPAELGQFFLNGILVDRRNGTPMEMDAYSIYLALKAIEGWYGANLIVEKRRIVDAVLERLRAKDGFWAHGAWTGSDTEIHMRFTAAAIRLLVEALHDGLLSDAQLVVDVLKKHVSYSERLPSGIWFFHDSLEVPGASAHYHNANRFRAWGGTPENCLVLNTHLDTIATMLHVLGRVEMSAEDRAWFTEQIDLGLSSLSAVLADKPNIWWSILNPIDALVRTALFRTALRAPKLGWFLHRVALKTYFRARLRVKRLYPRLVLSDGYIERDIGLLGTSFEYHLVNVYDLARLLNQLKTSNHPVDRSLIERCGRLVDRGIDHAVQTGYRDHWRKTLAENGRGTLLCEAILARLATRPAGPVPQHWISGYCEVRRSLPPTAALLGYDPLTLPSGYSATGPEADSGLFSDGTRFVFDVDHDRLRVLESCAVAGPTAL